MPPGCTAPFLWWLPTTMRNTCPCSPKRQQPGTRSTALCLPRIQRHLPQQRSLWADIALLKERIAPYVDAESVRYLRFPGGSTNTVSCRYGGKGLMKQLKAEVEQKGWQWVVKIMVIGPGQNLSITISASFVTD